MTPSTQPKLPTWIFIVTDLALLAAAGVIAANSHRPYSEPVMFAIVACVIAGAVVGLVPIVANYEAQKNDTLDDRQRALESLARTITTSAEQISIATSGLNEIAELAQKNLRHAEKLPHQLQDKIAEFQAQLANANDAEKEELEKEVVTLRAAESERLESISDKIAKSTAEWAKLEATAQKRLTAAADTLAKAQTEAGAIDTKLAAALAAFEAKLTASSERIERALEAAAKNVVTAPPVSLSAVAPAVTTEAAATPPETPAETSATDAPKTDSTAHPPKRPRKPRREEPVVEEAPTAAPVVEAPAKTEAEPPVVASVPAPTPTPEAKVEEPPPIPAASIPEVAPVAPHSAEPFAGNIAATALPNAPVAAVADTPAVDAPAPEAPTAEAAKPARKRAPKKPAPETPPDASLSLDITETPAAESAEVHEQSRSSDGATRLVVTAYIGIGNRLFIRGEGPGLSWEKGVPLQFVSIGKWRWETSDASAPVKFKLFKNDDTECTALGAQALDPGQQQEVTASF